jgi:signal transduction histidine kinase
MKACLVRLSFSTWLLAALFAVPAVGWSQDSSRPKRVLMLYGHDPNAPGVVAFTNELQAIVRAGSPTRVVFYDELLDLDRFPENAVRDELVDYIVEKYRGFPFDAILTDGTRALKFATERVSVHFPGVPIVYGLAFEPVVDFSALPENVTGRHHTLSFARTFELARALQPDAEKIVLVGGSSANDSLMLAVAVRDVTPLIGGMQLEVWQDWTYASLLKRVRALSPRTITILSSFNRDTLGQHFNSGDLIASITRSASGPMYGIARNWVGDGIVGGVTMDFGEDGKRTGQMLLQVLDRAPRGLPLPPPEVARPAQVVDWRALERWGLSRARLPSGTEVLFRKPTLWQEHRAMVLIAVGVLGIQSLLIVGLLYQRRARRNAEIQSQRNLALAADASRRQTMSALMSSIAHELSQPVSSMIHNAQAARMMISVERATPDAMGEILSDIESEGMLAIQIMDRQKTMLRNHPLEKTPIDLHSVILESLALVDHDMRARQIEATVNLSSNHCIITGDQVLLQQVLVNLLMNAMDAMAGTPPARRRVTISTEVRAADVAVSVRDDGTGLPAPINALFAPFATTKAHGLGVGLTITRAIIDAHGGTIEGSNNPEGGATFTVTLPRGETPTVPPDPWSDG